MPLILPLLTHGYSASAASFFLDSGESADLVAETSKTISGLNTSGATASSTIYVAISLTSAGTWADSSIGTVTIGDNSTTLVSQQRNSIAFRPAIAVFKAVGLTLSSSSNVVWTGAGSDNVARVAAAAFCVPGTATEASYGGSIGGSSANPLVVSRDVATGDHVIATMSARDYQFVGWNGLTAGGTFQSFDAEYPLVFGYAESVTAATPRVMSIDLDDTSGNTLQHIQIVITPD